MSTTKLSREVWLKHLTSQERTGGTQRSYCREHGLALSAFRYWKKRVAREAEASAPSFIEVPPVELDAEGVRDLCTIEFPNGCVLRVHAARAMRELVELAAQVKAL